MILLATLQTDTSCPAAAIFTQLSHSTTICSTALFHPDIFTTVMLMPAPPLTPQAPNGQRQNGDHQDHHPSLPHHPEQSANNSLLSMQTLMAPTYPYPPPDDYYTPEIPIGRLVV
jgi:hypothetical protein